MRQLKKIFLFSVSILSIGISNANAKVYDDITFHNGNCPQGKVLFPTKDVPDNMSYFRGHMGKWQITKISDGNVIMGRRYGYQVKKGSANSSFCITVEEQGTKYNRITYDRQCLPGSKPIPLIDVPANMDFFRSNMGKWQITQIADRHVIMGAGYGFAVKPGTAGYFYCANDGIIRDQQTMTRMVNEPGFFKELENKYPSLVVITSNGNLEPKFTLPIPVKEAHRFSLERNSDSNVQVEFQNTDYDYSGNIVVDVPKGLRLPFRYRGGNWYFVPLYFATNQLKLQQVENPTTLNAILRQYRAIFARTESYRVLPTLTLNSDAPDGASVEFRRENADTETVINYSGMTVIPDYKTTTRFVKQNGTWYTDRPSAKIVDNNTLIRQMGNDPSILAGFLKDYRRVIVKTWDGNWTRSLKLPNAADTGEGHLFEFDRKSGWGLLLQFPGHTVEPRFGSKTKFAAVNNKWIMQGQKLINSRAEIPTISTADGIKNLLDQYGNISIQMSDGIYTRNVYLPDDARNGEFVSVKRDSSWAVTVRYSGLQTVIGRGDEKLFYFSGNKWHLIDIN